MCLVLMHGVSGHHPLAFVHRHDRYVLGSRDCSDCRRTAGGEGQTCHAGAGIADELSENDKEERFLKRYLQYSRSHCFPRISAEASELLQAEYVSIRKQVRPGPDMLSGCGVGWGWRSLQGSVAGCGATGQPSDSL